MQPDEAIDSSVSSVEGRRERRAQRRRVEVLKAAKQLFLQKRFNEVSIEEIANASDVSRATIYSYFTGKMEIFQGILEYDMQNLADTLASKYRSDRSLLTNLKALSRAYIAFFNENPEYFGNFSFSFFPQREAKLPPEMAGQMRKRLGVVLSVIQRCLDDAIAKEEIARCDTWRSAVMIWGMWLGPTDLALEDLEPRIGDELEEIVEGGIETWVEGMLARKARLA